VPEEAANANGAGTPSAETPENKGEDSVSEDSGATPGEEAAAPAEEGGA
jgi:hypothetical protein